MSAAASPAFTMAHKELNEGSIKRRITIIWGLLFFNVIEVGQNSIIPIPHTISRVLTQAVLLPAVGLAWSVNRRLSFRPNAFLAAVTVLAIGGFLITLEIGTFHSDLRGARVILLALTLWMLTPWWGREDRLIAHAHLKALLAVLGSVVLGFMISPHAALFHGRLSGRIWPIPPTQVAHYAAVTAGIAAVFYLTREASRNKMAILFVGSVGILLFTHTRTATVAMAIAIVVAAVSLLSTYAAARRALLVLLIGAGVTAVFFRGPITDWATRGESTTQLNQLTGRTKVWTLVEAAPRSESQILFGFGLSNGSFDGLPIDSSWLGLYQELGLFGCVCGAVMIAVLLLLALRSPRGPSRALALFLITYCAIASYTETGLGLPSPYLLDLGVAASLLAPVPLTLPGRESWRARGLPAGIADAGSGAEIDSGLGVDFGTLGGAAGHDPLLTSELEQREGSA